MNPQKTAFIATDRSTDKALRAILQPGEPPVEAVMRDLGVDHQGARRRRIPVMKQRLAKAHKRKLKLRTLRIPALKIRLRLHRGGVQPAALWGVEGLAPRYRTTLRQAMAKHLGHNTGDYLTVPTTCAKRSTSIQVIKSSSTTSKPSTASSMPGPRSNWLRWSKLAITSFKPSSTHATQSVDPWLQPSPISKNGDGRLPI